VLRHDLFFRVMHWLIFVEGIVLTLTGMQLGGILGVAIFPSGNMMYHIVVGITFIATATLLIYGIVSTGDYRWIGLRRIPYSFKFIISETKGWFGLAPKPSEPMLYDAENRRYAEKLVPSVIVVFWSFVLLGLLLALTGLALAFPQQFSFVYLFTDFIGGTLTGVTGLAFMLTFHRLATYALVVLVAMHIYASFIFKLVGSMISGKRNEKILVQRVAQPAAESTV
jgi:F420-nonreducing hydrogenase I cytochrome b subunit